MYKSRRPFDCKYLSNAKTKFRVGIRTYGVKKILYVCLLVLDAKPVVEAAGAIVDGVCFEQVSTLLSIGETRRANVAFQCLLQELQERYSRRVTNEY